MCDKYDTAILRQLFPKGTYNIFTFDFRAHGEVSHNQWCTFGKDEVHEVITAGTFIKNHPALKNKPVFAYGFSMGAVAAIEAQAQVPALFNGMILDCPFASSENVIKKGLENAKISLFGYEFSLPGKYLLEKYAFHPYVQTLVKYTLKCLAKLDSKDINTIIYPLYPVETIKQISIPCFFIHCRHDEKISITDAKALYQNAQGFKRQWITNGRRHYDSLFYNPEQYRFHIRQFLQQILDGSYHQQSQEYTWEDPLEESIPILVAIPAQLA
jgi:pimeloyl-ACP methyl ester carboxylesterase